MRYGRNSLEKAKCKNVNPDVVVGEANKQGRNLKYLNQETILKRRELSPFVNDIQINNRYLTAKSQVKKPSNPEDEIDKQYNFLMSKNS